MVTTTVSYGAVLTTELNDSFFYRSTTVDVRWCQSSDILHAVFDRTKERKWHVALARKVQDKLWSFYMNVRVICNMSLLITNCTTVHSTLVLSVICNYMYVTY